jgi:hypothetical protein
LKVQAARIVRAEPAETLPSRTHRLLNSVRAEPVEALSFLRPLIHRDELTVYGEYTIRMSSDDQPPHWIGSSFKELRGFLGDVRA